jgi:hypothetical protein
MVVNKAAPGAKILMADDQSELNDALAHDVDLILFNRELGYGFEDKMGVDAIKRLHALKPDLRMMLISNYADAQADAVANGALPGFGKREIGSPRVIEALKAALETPTSNQPKATTPATQQVNT